MIKLMNKSRVMHGLVFLLLFFLISAVTQGIAFADNSGGDLTEDVRIYDQAGLFGDQERMQLETEISSLKQEMNMDVVVVTTDDSEGKSAQKYAEDFYVKGNFGTGRDYSGILFLIDMDNRELYVAPVGKMNRYITDERVEKILDNVYDGASAGDYEECVKVFLEDTRSYYKKGIPSNQYNYDEETGRISVYKSIKWYEALFAVAVAAISGGAVCMGVVSQYSMKKQRGQASGYHMAYRADCKFSFSDKTDHFIDKTVTQMVIPRQTHTGGGSGGSFSGRSTTHSSSGRTFGGGGRKF